MAQPVREKGGRVVFIGNIPYGVSEEQIMELFGRCGKVVSFRLVYDKDTGRPKGFGFLEYETPDAAAAATRNLNDFEIMGRQLKVDYSNDNDKGAKDNAVAGPPPTGAGGLPPLPAGQPLAPGLTAPNAISKTISAIPAPQLLDILSQMKALVTSDPAKATQLLQTAPQLGYALFQALLLLGLVDTNILGSLVATTAPAPQAPPPQAYPPPGAMPGYPPAPAQYGQPGFPPANYATPPPVQQFQPPPVQQPQFALPPGLDPSVIETVKGLTRDQIMGLDENSRNEIIKIRMALGLQPVPV